MTSVNTSSYPGLENSLHHFQDNKKITGVERKKEKVCQQAKSINKSSQRTFGDISNRVGRLIKNEKEGGIKPCKTDQNSSNSCHTKTAVKTDSHDQLVSPISVPEFRPDYEEIEDYEDVLPPEFQLSEKTISQFVQFWKKPKADIDLFIPSSPVHVPEFISIQIDRSAPVFTKLEPVLIDDSVLFDMPPPFFEI